MAEQDASSALPPRRAEMHFFAPAPQLVPYLSAIYSNIIDVPEGERMVDILHPEWANLRFIEGPPTCASIGPGELAEMPECVLVGPTRFATTFSTGTIRNWGIGLLPLGWAKFLRVPAESMADRVADVMADPLGEPFRALRPILADANLSEADKAAAINAHFLALLDRAPADDPLIGAIQAALAVPEVRTVEQLAEQVGASRTSIARACAKAFGFSPIVLLRRQRLLRTLAEVMLRPQNKWGAVLDLHYSDQPHFIREFTHFIGMKPRAYMALPHPIVDAAVRGRLAAAGAPMQLLHRPPEG